MTGPVRVQMSRTRGWQMPPNTVKVDRTTKWGSPFRVGQEYRTAGDCVRRFRAGVIGPVLDGKQCPSFAHPDSYFGRVAGEIAQLRGKNLACWCALDQPCHADVLLELANR